MLEKLTKLLDAAALHMDSPGSEDVAKFLLSHGVLVPPVQYGDTVYAVIGDDAAKEMDCDQIEPYTVFGISYAKGIWSVVDYENEEFLVGDDLCLLTLAEAEERLAEKRRKQGGGHSC